MPRAPRALVLDSWSIIAYFEDEPAGERVADLIADANECGAPIQLTVINAAEVWHIIARGTSTAEADTSIDQLRQLGIEFVDVGWELSRQAGAYKSKYRMSLADCYAAALAKRTEATLLTGDPEFKQVERKVKITWL